MRPPLLIALNMMDMAKERGIEIDVDGLSRQLGCPIVALVVSKNQGDPRPAQRCHQQSGV
jgi:ferrous iron transport protein B